MTYRTPISIAFLATLAAQGCAIPDRGDPLPEVVDARDTRVAEVSDADSVEEVDAPDEEIDAKVPVSFAASVHQFLVDNCTASGCHSSAAGGFAITGDVDADYEATLREVTVGDGEGSKLVKKTSGVTSHTGGPLLQPGTSEYDLVVAWINDGANP